MIKITQPPLIYVRSSAPVRPVAPLEKTAKERESLEADQPFVERRKKRERRNRKASRGPFDMRSGRGRRKGDSVDIDV